MKTGTEEEGHLQNWQNLNFGLNSNSGGQYSGTMSSVY